MVIVEQYNTLKDKLKEVYDLFIQKDSTTILDSKELSGFEKQIEILLEDKKNNYIYDENKVYDNGDLVIDTANRKLYISLVTNNNFILSNNEKWKEFGGGSASSSDSRMFAWAKVSDNTLIDSSGNITYEKSYNDHIFTWEQAVHNTDKYSVEWSNLGEKTGSYGGNWIFLKDYAQNKFSMKFSENTNDDIADFTVMFFK